MTALYAACSRARNAASTAWTTGGAVQSRVVGVPPCACARSTPNPYAKLTSTASPPGEAQFPATVNHVEPREKCGGTTLLLKCPNPTAMSSAPCAPAASMESSTSEYCTRKAAVSVASVVSPAWAAPRRSLFPSQTLTKVGCAAIMACVWVRPPSISSVRAFEFVPGVGKFEMPSITSAPGTATLVKKGGMFGLRNRHVMSVPPATRAPVKMLVNSGGQPGQFRPG